MSPARLLPRATGLAGAGLVAFACSGQGSSSGGSSVAGTSVGGAGSSSASHAASTGAGGSGGAGGALAEPCTTRVSYGHRWIHPPDHPESFDVVAGLVTWDGRCELDGPNAVATLSNGWKPVFSGHDACTIALDFFGDCGVPPVGCTTRIGYGPSWKAPPDHPLPYDDVGGGAFGDGECRDAGGTTRATSLSNGWQPHFDGDCQLAFRYVGCGGLYTNPVVTSDCPDPGVLKDGDHYVMACTGGALGAAFPLRTTKDLVHFTEAGHVLTGEGFGTWSIGDYWAPEIHRIGTGYVAYYSARHVSGHLAIGAAVASSALGPYVDVGAPLVHEATVGHIDAHVFADEGGTHYLAWKDDGNAFGKPTPIVAQALGADGLTRVGPKVVLLVNDLPWEGALVEAPWVVRHDGFYYLFYSANAFYDERYAVGVARADAPLGPYVKLGPPILTTRGAWAGPGHGSVVPAPRGDDVFVHHAWRSEHVNEAPGRLVLVDRIQWTGGWPTLFGAPSSSSRPLP